MNTEAQKLELIQWLTQLQDVVILQKIMEIKQINEKTSAKKREFGCGKDIVLFVADDFNEPLEMFEEYTKK